MVQRFKFIKSSLFLAIAALVGVVAIEPAIPAERIDFNYSLLGFSLKVEDLAAFAETGEVSNSLNFYLKRIPSQQREKLQKFLQQSYNVDPILVYRYSRTSAGIEMLQRIGEIIQLPGNLNGFYGLRAAVVQAAATKSGINLIDFLKLFPTDIRLDLGELLELVEEVSDREEDTKEFIASLSSDETKSDLKDFPDLSSKGQYRVVKQTLELYDRDRNRTLNTDLYLPEVKTDSIPVIVVSNGLGAKRDRFKGLANYLASHGFAVAIPDHPGSDRRRQKAFLRGLHKENFDASDYIDRPLDISYILDELEQINRQLNNRLDLQQVGIFGYSIGGTTALSLAGAELDLARLKRDCDRPLDLLNISILYQCRALELPPQQQSLKDERIKAAFLFVPFGNSLFSQEELSKISMPVMWQVVDRDFLTSLLTEQVPLFDSLENSNRYLVVSEKIPHSNVTLSNQQQSSQAEAFNVAKNYQNILSLIFFKNYVARDKEYQSYLSSEYIQAIEQEPYELHLIEEIVEK